MNLSNFNSYPSEIKQTLPETDKPLLILTVGISGSGKTYYSKNLTKLGFLNFNNDDLRRSIFGIDHWEQYNFDENETLISSLRQNIINSFLKQNKNIVVSNLNCSKKLIKHYQKLAKQNNYHLRCVLFDIPLEICLKRNRVRTEMKLKDEVLVSQMLAYNKIYDFITNDSEIDYYIYKGVKCV